MIGRCGQVMLVRLPGLAPSPSRVLKGYSNRTHDDSSRRTGRCLPHRCLLAPLPDHDRLMLGDAAAWQPLCSDGLLRVLLPRAGNRRLLVATQRNTLQRSATRRSATQRSTLQRRAPALRLPVLPSVAALPRQQALISIIRTVIPVIHILMPIICTLIPIIRTLMPIIRTLIPVFCILILWKCRCFGSSPTESRTTYTG